MFAWGYCKVVLTRGGFLGIKDAFKRAFSRKEEKEVKEAKEIEAQKQRAEPAKYPDETCALCGQPGCDKKWAGQYWHKKCLRNMRKTARGMI